MNSGPVTGAAAGGDEGALLASINLSPITTVITNPRLPDNPVVAANPAFCALTGYEEAEIIGRNCRFLAGEATEPHDLFASGEGTLVPDGDPAKIGELWSPFAGAWYEEGRQDSKLRLIRFDPGPAQIWLNQNSLFAGVRMLLGSDPKKDYADKVAHIDLSA